MKPSPVWTMPEMHVPGYPTAEDVFLHTKRLAIEEVLRDISACLDIHLVTDGYDVWHRTRQNDGQVCDRMIDRMTINALWHHFARLALTMSIEREEKE